MFLTLDFFFSSFVAVDSFGSEAVSLGIFLGSETSSKLYSISFRF